MLRKPSKMRLGITLALAGALTLQGVPTAAFAVTSAELQEQANAARAELEVLGQQVQAAGEMLHETQYQLEVTNQEIEQTTDQIEQRKAELAEAQEVLGKRVATNYKTGGVGLVSILLESSSYEELVSNMYYAGKIYESDSEAIAHVKEIRSQLEEEEAALEAAQAEQETLLEEQTAQMQQLEDQEAAQATYVSNLDAAVAAKIEEERQAELERQRKEAEEAAARAAAQAEAEAAGTGSTDGGSSASPTVEIDSSSSVGGLSAAQRSAIISAAYSQLGVPYVFGSMSPGSGFDCSGFSSWCYAQAGISLPHSAAAQSYMATGVDYSSLQPGDLVFWIGTGSQALTGNHVAIYLGGGSIIHANWGGVATQALYGGVTKYGVIG